jgi:hypothetical protein
MVLRALGFRFTSQSCVRQWRRSNRLGRLNGADLPATNPDLFSEKMRREFSWETFFWAAAMLVRVGVVECVQRQTLIGSLALVVSLSACPWLCVHELRAPMREPCAAALLRLRIGAASSTA